MVTWWSEQFWINVATTSLGILASVSLGVGLYYLKRKHDKKDARTKEEREEELRLAEKQRQEVASLVNLVRELRDAEHDYKKWITTGPWELQVASAQMREYAFTLKDANLIAFALSYSQFLVDCADVFRELKDKVAVANRPEEADREELIDVLAHALATSRAMGKVEAYAPMSLIRYVNHGGPLSSRFFQDPDFFADKTREISVSEDAKPLKELPGG
jgi:hypothetical protein